MALLKDVIAFILKHYPEHMRSELSNARVTKMIYLADWHQAIKRGRQMTNINWYFDNYGPYVNDVKNEVETYSNLFDLINTNNMYGSKKYQLELRDSNYIPQLSDEEKQSLEHVIAETKTMYWNSFIKLVYSTYPITSSNRYSHLDLSQKAYEYCNIATHGLAQQQD